MNTPLHALIIEDEELDTVLLVDTLRDGGYDLTWERVQTAEAMGAALDAKRWDIVIADYNLPYFSGLEALALVQDREIDLPLIIVSRAVDEDVAVMALHLGATDYVMKRNLGRLVPAVQRALREAEERRVRLQAEEALRESEERYRELVESANDIVLSIDLRGNFLAMNRAGELISGYSREELCRMNIADVLTPESHQLAVQMIHKKLIDNRPTTYELEMIARDGRRIPLEVSSQLIYHGDAPVGVQGIARDVTERHRAEAELRARERKQATIAQLSQSALATPDLDALFREVVESVTETLGLEYGAILELLPAGDRLLVRAGVGWKPGIVGEMRVEAGPHSLAGYTLLSSQPVVVEDMQMNTLFSVPAVLTEHRITSGMSVVIPGQRHPFGTLGAHSESRRSFGQDDVLFLQAVANLLGTAIERKRLEEERARHAKELATRVLQAQEEERKRIARELHDDTAQSLSVLLAHLDLLEQHIPEDSGPLQSGFERIGALARRALDATRALSHDLRPTILDDVGLIAALEWLTVEHEQTYGGSAEFHAASDHERSLPTEVEVALFRIAQEALTNSGKHSDAHEVHVSLSFPDSTAELVIEDDGSGFELKQVPRPTREGRLGLYGMHERATLLGGSIEIETDPGRGTRIVARIPLADEWGAGIGSSSGVR